MISLEKIREIIDSYDDTETDIRKSISALRRLRQMYRGIGLRHPSIYSTRFTPPISIELRIREIVTSMEEYTWLLESREALDGAELMAPSTNIFENIDDMIVTVYMIIYKLRISRTLKFIQRNKIRLHIWQINRKYKLNVSK